eukprot:7505406-Alexandrium_andersonii.AAC.1
MEFAYWFRTEGYMDKGRLDFVEYFSGAQAITNAFKDKLFAASAYDVKHGEHKNILTDLGFINAVNLVARLKPLTGMQWHGVVCSTWVQLSRGSTKRSRSARAECVATNV